MSSNHAQGTRDSDRLSAAFAASERAAPRADCPQPDELWAAVSGELAAGSRRAVVRHIAECRSCAADWRLAAQLAPVPSAAPVTAPSGQRKPWRLAVPAFALVFACVAVFAHLRRPPSPTVPVAYRTPASQGSPHGQPARCAAVDCVLRWTAGPRGTRYRLRITTPDLRVLAVLDDLESPQYSVPPEQLTGMTAGSVLLWQVDRVDADGQVVSSATFKTTLE
ncbi:MAG: zf-HC2 domain-containing protein [Proteobacteria bacterium]|nr:zf-HC2 domain-containing protein [Pseudomonadota bacterium]